MQALSKNSHLHYLNLNNNSGGTEAAKALAESLLTNTALNEIFLTGNNVWDEGADAILKAVEKSQTVQMMDLDGNKCDKIILKKISAAVDKNL
jgi:Ran GTPase-activating protein (RanGAP) involved in mRNA processing and transport